MIEFTRDQRRTLMRVGRVTIREVVELDADFNVVPCGHSEDASAIPVYHDTQRKDDAFATVIAIEREDAYWKITYALTFERERPRLLAKAGGYTDIPALALSEEPEAVPEGYQERLCKLADDRNDDIKQKRIAEMRRGIDNAAAGLAPAALTRLDRKDIERINFYMSRIEERAGLDTEMDEAA